MAVKIQLVLVVVWWWIVFYTTDSANSILGIPVIMLLISVHWYHLKMQLFILFTDTCKGSSRVSEERLKSSK